MLKNRQEVRKWITSVETSLKQFACYKEEREGQYLESDEGIFFFDAKDFKDRKSVV